MKEYSVRVCFTGRNSGAIGICHFIVVTFVSDHKLTMDEINGRLYHDYEHISHLNFLWLEGETE